MVAATCLSSSTLCSSLRRSRCARAPQWFAGDNVDTGKDYTLFALIDGVVAYEHESKTKKRVSVYPAAPAGSAS